MIRLNFKEFEIYAGVSKDRRQKGDARETFADVLYTKGCGVRSGSLTMRIYESDGEIEFDEQDVDFMLAIAMQHCNPAFIDGLQEQVERGKNNDNDKKE